MKRNLALAAAGTLLAAFLTGCGGGSESSGTTAYCDSMESAKKSFDEFDSGNLAGFEEVITTFHELAGKAPDDIAKDWATLDDALSGIEDALAKAGLDFSDLEAVSNGELPEGVDLSKLQQLGEDLQAVTSDKVEEAATAIEKHAKDECDIDLSDS